MSETIDVLKDPSGQQPIPTVWRETLAAIVERIRHGDREFQSGPPNVTNRNDNVSRYMEESLTAYGATLTALPESTWQTSVCQWMDGFWEVYVDLYTEQEGRSDLVLFLLVRESGLGFVFEIQGIYVP
jgi:hypothetical protein